LAVVLLLFVIGLEMTPPRLRGLGRNAATRGVPQIAASAAAIGELVCWQSGSWLSALVLGLAVSMSPTTVVLHLLEDLSGLNRVILRVRPRPA
jgi:glutathione-regulated potassium-efflux system protein KefB